MTPEEMPCRHKQTILFSHPRSCIEAACHPEKTVQYWSPRLSAAIMTCDAVAYLTHFSHFNDSSINADLAGN